MLAAADYDNTFPRVGPAKWETTFGSEERLPMRVTVSVFGRFHAFYLARQLQDRGYLERLITTYPVFEVQRYGLDGSRVSSIPLPDIAQRLWQRVPKGLQARYSAQPLLHGAFERSAARQVPAETELYVGWSSYSEAGLERAKRLGAVTVLERGSTHIAYQRDVLEEEYRRFGVTAQLPHARIVAKETREYDMADYICVPSTFARQSFIERGIMPDKVIQVPYGVDVSVFTPTDVQTDVFRVLHVGAISLQKGVQYLVQAFAEARLPRAELWLVGDLQPDVADVLARYSGVFRHIPRVPQQQLVEYYTRASVFALCSVQEGLALVQAQAMACGLPIISTPNTGGEDLYDDGVEGFSVPARDVAALRECLTYLYENRDVARAMGLRGAERARAAHTWDEYGRKVVENYSRMLSKRCAVQDG